MKIGRLLACALLLGCAVARAQAPQMPLEISLARGSEAEKAAKAQIERIVARYDVSPWLFTRKIVVDERALPHSHPVLTLHTRHLKDDELLLSTFVHEQLHWYLGQNAAKSQAAVGELRKRYPDIPVGFPRGSSDAESNYYHLLVIFLEYRANRALLGELRARQVMEFWSQDHYTWLYATVMEQEREIGRIVRDHGLIPDAGR
ncbi:hypothetical protein FCE95_08015 [Luteimonas gilva]|uniref:Uncharacterized protein n=1 Tax=Luteimonas gilva TaxID=2572684 RepID=A0A4U5JKH0_9GAMM|nr:hypothetical protein [Luteimonas gilva]TKR30080.1 hypothetical protein FCE95_08015 [Luteimonas gilva]